LQIVCLILVRVAFCCVEFENHWFRALLERGDCYWLSNTVSFAFGLHLTPAQSNSETQKPLGRRSYASSADDSGILII
jgi:hypothetical protein